MQDKYVRFEAAGDMIVGRYVAGLPFDSPSFATLPPFLAPLTNQQEEQSEFEQHLRFAMDAVFPGVPPSLRMICQFGLAPLLYHDSYLRSELPPSHLLFTTPLFSTSTREQLEWLRRRVVCRNYQVNDPISQSGIPPHIGIMVSLDQYTAEVERMRESMTEKFESILKRHIHGSVMTMEAMEKVFETVISRYVHGQHAPPSEALSSVSTANATTTPQSELYMWDGIFHRVPREFVLPSGTLRVVWQTWCAGQPPLRLLSKHDMSVRVAKVRLSERQRLMRHVESLLSNEEVRRAYSSIDSAGLLFAQINSRLSFSISSSKGRQRRLDQLSWRTLARELNSLNTH